MQQNTNAGRRSTPQDMLERANALRSAQEKCAEYVENQRKAKNSPSEATKEAIPKAEKRVGVIGKKSGGLYTGKDGAEAVAKSLGLDGEAIADIDGKFGVKVEDVNASIEQLAFKNAEYSAE